MQDILKFLKEENVSGFRDYIRSELDRRYGEAKEGLYKDVVESLGMKYEEPIFESEDMKPECEPEDEPSEDAKEKDEKKEVKDAVEAKTVTEGEECDDEGEDSDEDDDDSDDESDDENDDEGKKVLTEK